VRIDLDDPARAASNDATVRRYWQEVARPLGLGAVYINEAVARARGNLQHATMLRQYLAGMPASQRRVKSIPGGLAALLDKLWARVAADPLAVRGFGLLCVAREALTREEIGVAAGWTEEADRQAFMWSARELLVETWRPGGPREYRLHHDSIREHIAAALGAAALRDLHAVLAERLATWPPPADPAMRRYALCHALIHRAEAGDRAGVWQLASDAGFLDAKRRELGARDAAADLARLAARCRAAGDAALAERFDDQARSLAAEPAP